MSGLPGRSEWLLLAHIGAAFIFFGAALTTLVAGLAATRARRAREVALLARLAHRADTLLLWPSLVILVGAGAQLASSEDVYSRGWVRYGVLLTAVVALIGGGVSGRLNRRRLREAERLEPSAELEAGAGAPVLLAGMLAMILLVVVFWLMTAKPGIYG
jgi:uncharacterized membrane protein